MEKKVLNVLKRSGEINKSILSENNSLFIPFYDEERDYNESSFIGRLLSNKVEFVNDGAFCSSFFVYKYIEEVDMVYISNLRLNLKNDNSILEEEYKERLINYNMQDINGETCLLDKDNNFYYFNKSGKLTISKYNTNVPVNNYAHSVLIDGEIVEYGVGSKERIEIYLQSIFNKLDRESFFVRGDGSVYFTNATTLSTVNDSIGLTIDKTPLKFTSKKRLKKVDELNTKYPLKDLTDDEAKKLLEYAKKPIHNLQYTSIKIENLDDGVVLRYFIFAKEVKNDKLEYIHKEFMRVYSFKSKIIITHNVNNRWVYNKSDIKYKLFAAGFDVEALKELKGRSDNKISYLGEIMDIITNMPYSTLSNDNVILESNPLSFLIAALNMPALESLYKLGFEIRDLIYMLIKEMDRVDYSINSNFISLSVLLSKSTIYEATGLSKDKLNFIKERDLSYFSKLGKDELSKHQTIVKFFNNNLKDVGLEEFIEVYNYFEDIEDKFYNQKEMYLYIDLILYEKMPEKHKIMLMDKVIEIYENDFSGSDFEKVYLKASLSHSIVKVYNKIITLIKNNMLNDGYYNKIKETPADELFDFYKSLNEYYDRVTKEDQVDFTVNSKIASSLEFEGSNYVIIRAKNFKDLKLEGDALSHCVYNSYADQCYRGDTIIMFVREKSNINKPFYTVEVSPEDKTVEQIRGFANQSIPKGSDLEEFIKQWKEDKNLI